MYAAGRIPGSFFRREGRPERGRDPHLPPHRPPAAPVVRQGPAQRDPGRHHGDGAQPRPPLRRRGDQRRVDVDAARRPAVQRPDRRHPRGAHRGPVGRVPDAHAQLEQADVRHGRRRPGRSSRRRRDHDGRGRGHREHDRARRRRRHRADRGGRRRGPRGRQAVHPRAVRRAGRAAPRWPPSRPASSRCSPTTSDDVLDAVEAAVIEPARARR